MSYTSTYYHFVFRTKGSRRVLTPENSERLFRYINGITQKLGCTLIQINGMSEHIHIAVSLSPSVSVALFMQKVKSGSSSWIKSNLETFRGFDGWATGYFCSTFSGGDVQKVTHYIANQQQHHLNKSFRDELADFFERANMRDKFDYFWRD